MMERRVKERLIGATLLVVLIVLIVPEMLSGPKPPTARPLTAGLPAPTRSVSVDLTTSQATADPDLAEGAPGTPPPPGAASAGAAADDAPAAAGAPTAAGDDASGRAPPEAAASGVPTVTTLKAQEPSSPPSRASSAGASGPAVGSSTAAALETPSSGPKSAGHRGWSVQLGSFASRANADRLVHQVQSRGAGSPYVSPIGSGTSVRYRVRVGPFSDRAAAERAAGKLKVAGHGGTLVAPAS
jgi:DedD protein